MALVSYSKYRFWEKKLRNLSLFVADEMFIEVPLFQETPVP